VVRPCPPPVGRAHSFPKRYCHLLRARQTGFSHRVGAPTRLRLGAPTLRFAPRYRKPTRRGALVYIYTATVDICLQQESVQDRVYPSIGVTSGAGASPFRGQYPAYCDDPTCGRCFSY
jgi:hypothetical protein